jgi:hypothetical protein
VGALLRASEQAARATVAAIEATLQSAEAKVAQGDAQLLADRLNEARLSYNQAWVRHHDDYGSPDTDPRLTGSR